MKSIFNSERQNLLSSRIGRVITCENYCKWYDLYYTLDFNECRKLSDLFDDSFDIDYRDHSWRPVSVLEFAKKHELKVGLVSYIAMILRWCETNDVELISENDLPSYELFNDIIVDDYGSIDKCDFIDNDDSSPLYYKAFKGDIVRKFTHSDQKKI